MNIKSAYHYQVSENTKAIISFYIIVTIVLLSLFACFGITYSSEEGPLNSGNFGGMEMSSMIFLLVVGISSFKDSFSMLQQNGISRKTFFISHIYTSITITLIMAAIDTLLSLIFKAFTELLGLFHYYSMYEQLYTNSAFGRGSIIYSIIGYFFNFSLYLSILAVGYFIRLVYYRLGKPGTTMLSVFVPIFFTLILPIFDSKVTNGKIYTSFVKLLDNAFGITSQQPVNTIITCLLAFMLLSIFSWLLTRKAVLKDK